MQPTMKLRFLKRNVTVDFGFPEYRYVLQQWWEQKQGFGATPEEFNKVIGEWRDVPLEISE